MRNWIFPILGSSLMIIGFIAYLVVVPGENTTETVPQEAPAPTLEPVKVVRNVTQNNMVLAPKLDTEFLERLPARKPPPPPPKPPEPELVKRPVVLSAGVLRIGDKLLKLADIKPVPLDDKCPSEQGGEWPCGMFARTEMRQFFRGRPIECEPGEETSETIVTRCRLDHFDISAWLVLTGWATPIGDMFSEELAEAKTRQRGIWRKSAP